MKRFALAFSLLCVLSGTALAGIIPSTDVTAPQPPAETTAPGDIPSTDSTSPGDIHSVDVSILLTLVDLVF